MHPLRIIGVSATVPNLSDVGEWLGAPMCNTCEFGQEFRPVPLSIQVSLVCVSRRVDGGGGEGDCLSLSHTHETLTVALAVFAEACFLTRISKIMIPQVIGGGKKFVNEYGR